MNNPQTIQPRFNGLDYLRVFFAIAIVAWHTKALGPTGLVDTQFQFNFRDFIYANIFLLAVPLFVQVSLFLYILNQKNKENYFLKRIGTIAFLFLFWMAVLVLIFYKESPRLLAKPDFWLSGGATPLYFLLVILILTLVAQAFIWLSRILSRKSYLILTLTCLLLSIILIVAKTYFLPALGINSIYLMSHWSAFNFLPYVFSAVIFADIYDRRVLKNGVSPKWILITGTLALAVALAEYRYLLSQIFLEFDGMIVPPYSRLSLVIATGLVFSIFAFREFRPSKIIVFLSSLTLGVYILHVFMMNILAGLLPDGLFEAIRITPAYFLIILAMSGTAAWLLKDKKIV